MQLVSRGANGKPLQEYGKIQIWLKICGQTKRYDFHVVEVTKSILSVSCLCDNGVATHLEKESFLRFGDGHEPLIRKGGVYFVKAQTVNACVQADVCTERTEACKLMDRRKTDAYTLTDSQKIDAYEMTIAQKIDAYEMTIAQKTDEYEMTSAQKKKTDEYEMTSAQKKKTDAYEMTGAQKKS